MELKNILISIDFESFNIEIELIDDGSTNNLLRRIQKCVKAFQYDKSEDVWKAGKVIYKLVTGYTVCAEHCFKECAYNENLSKQLNYHLAKYPEIQKLLFAMLEFDANRRSTTKQLLKQLNSDSKISSCYNCNLK